MVKLLSTLSLIFALVLFPPAVLAVVSNNAVPGDATYPIKRSLEDVIYAVASVNPISKAWFAAARSDRRFKEVATLLANGKLAKNSLQELVSQTAVAAEQIQKIQDPVKKQEAIKSLAVSIQNYNQSLLQVSSQTGSSGTAESTTIPAPKGTPAPVRISYTPVQPSTQPAITQTPQNTSPVTPVPTNTPPQAPAAEEDSQISQTVAQLQQIGQQLQLQSIAEPEKDNEKTKIDKESGKEERKNLNRKKEDKKESVKEEGEYSSKGKKD